MKEKRRIDLCSAAILTLQVLLLMFLTWRFGAQHLDGDDSAERILEGDWDILVDAIDTIGNKAVIDKAALDRGLPVYASMGAAMHFDPSAVRIATLKKTDTCPLASQLRRQMRDVDTSGMICVYSAEPVTAKTEDRDEHGKSVLGSLSTIPAIFGMTLASLVIRRITGC